MKKCSKCKSKMEADVFHVYTSSPPMYLYTCPKCGKKEYGFCFENDDE